MKLNFVGEDVFELNYFKAKTRYCCHSNGSWVTIVKTLFRRRFT